MNRRRINQQREDVKPEQLKVEKKHIQTEKLELKQDRQMNQRRRLQKQVQQ